MKHIIKTKYRIGDLVVVDFSHSPIGFMKNHYINGLEVLIIKAGYNTFDSELYTVVILEQLPVDIDHKYIHEINGEWLKRIETVEVNSELL